MFTGSKIFHERHCKSFLICKTSFILLFSFAVFLSFSFHKSLGSICKMWSEKWWLEPWQVINFHFQSLLSGPRFLLHLFETIDVDWRGDSRFIASIEHLRKFPLKSSTKNDNLLLLKLYFYSCTDKTII